MYSTIEQFKSNVASLSTKNSGVKDSDIMYFIDLADQVLTSDLYPLYILNDDSTYGYRDYIDINLLSQYKAASLGTSSFYGATRSKETPEVTTFDNLYNNLLTNIKHGKSIIKLDGTKLTRRSKIAYKDQNELFDALEDQDDDILYT